MPGGGTAPAAPRTVLLVSGATILGGAERSMLLLAGGLADTPALGWVPVIAAPPGRLLEAARERGLRTEQIELTAGRNVSVVVDGRKTYPPRAVASYARDSVAYAADLVRVIRRVRPALVHSNSMGSHAPVAIAGRLARRPTVLHLREITKPGRGRQVFDRISSLSQALIAISTATRDVVRHRRVVVVLNPVEAPPAATTPTGAWDLPRPVVGFLGRLDLGKGIETLIDAVGPLDVHVAVVGEPWSGTPDYVRGLHERGEQVAPGRIHFIGALPTPWVALAGMDVLAVPSRMEPFGRVAAEGQLAGVPVVAADAGGLPEIVTDRVDGLLVAPEDPQALRAALVELLDDPAFAARLAQDALVRAQRYAPARHAETIAALYDSLVPRPPAVAAPAAADGAA